MRLNTRIQIRGTIRFDTAFHLGSGEGGAAASDLGVLLDHEGVPLLPGSSLKGKFRSTAESLAEHLGMTTCFLDRHHPTCPGGSEALGKAALKELGESRNETAKVSEVLERLCDVCRLFGSVLAMGRLRFHDASASEWAGALEIRDGVAIDRDSGTAVDKAKYDFEVVPAKACFPFQLDGENLSDRELALVAVVLQEWQEGTQLGGMTSRGLGRARLETVEIHQVDLRNPEERHAYLTKRTMRVVPVEEVRQTIANVLGGAHA